MATTTTHYGLTKPEVGDTIRTDIPLFAANFEEIDIELYRSIARVIAVTFAPAPVAAMVSPTAMAAVARYSTLFSQK